MSYGEGNIILLGCTTCESVSSSEAFLHPIKYYQVSDRSLLLKKITSHFQFSMKTDLHRFNSETECHRICLTMLSIDNDDYEMQD